MTVGSFRAHAIASALQAGSLLAAAHHSVLAISCGLKRAMMRALTAAQPLSSMSPQWCRMVAYAHSALLMSCGTHRDRSACICACDTHKRQRRGHFLLIYAN